MTSKCCKGLLQLKQHQHLGSVSEAKTCSPSKWKKWLCWFKRGLPSAAATGTKFSSRFSPGWSSLTRLLSAMFRDILHVGQEVSCSSQERRQELPESAKLPLLSIFCENSPEVLRLYQMCCNFTSYLPLSEI